MRIKIFNQHDAYSVKLRKIIDKILMVLPEDKTNSLPFSPNPGDESLYMFKPSVPINRSIFHSIFKALLNREVIEIEYCISEDKNIEKIKIEPLSINTPLYDCSFLKDHGQNVLAWKKGNRSKIETFSLNKISKVNKTGKHFRLPANFDSSSLPNYYISEEAITPPIAINRIILNFLSQKMLLLKL